MTDAMIRDLQTELWDFYKDVHGIRPRHWTTAEWASLDFLMEQRAVLCNIVNNMSPEQRAEEGWYDDYDAPKMSGPGVIIAGRIEQHFGVEE